MSQKLSILLGTSLFLTAVTTTTVNANMMGGGTTNIPAPANDQNVRAFIINGSTWKEYLKLPQTATDGAVITIKSISKFPSYLNTSNTNISSLVSLKITNENTNYSFKYSQAQGKWIANIKTMSPQNDIGNFAVPFSNDMFQTVSLKDGAWAGKITLPNNMQDGALIQITSNAEKDALINTSNLLFSSSYTIKKGDNFWFQYNNKLQKWVPEFVKPRAVNLAATSTQIPAINAAVTKVIVPDNMQTSVLNLPNVAKNRDKLIITSNSPKLIKISNNNVNKQVTMKLKNADRYVFMWVADRAHWVLMSSPEAKINLKNLTNGQIADMGQPTKVITVSGAGKNARLHLPNQANVGDTVIIKSKVNSNITLTAKNGLQNILEKSEKKRFIYTASGWKIDNFTVDILLMNSPNVVNKLGAKAAKLRLTEEVELANRTAENSGAKFYLRAVGYEVQGANTNSNDLHDLFKNVINNKLIAQKRAKYSADAVYYEGIQNKGACGLAQRSLYTAQFKNAVFVGSSGCQLSVLRHEFGHVLGLIHGNIPAGYIGQGLSHPLGGTVMNGNALAYYSSPNLYHPKYGYRLGEVNQIDAVSMINSNAQKVSKFY